MPAVVAGFGVGIPVGLIGVGAAEIFILLMVYRCRDVRAPAYLDALTF